MKSLTYFAHDFAIYYLYFFWGKWPNCCWFGIFPKSIYLILLLKNFLKNKFSVLKMFPFSFLKKFKDFLSISFYWPLVAFLRYKFSVFLLNLRPFLLSLKLLNSVIDGQKTMTKKLLMSLNLCFVTFSESASDESGSCLLSHIHKPSPSPEPNLNGECRQWRSNSCCMANGFSLFKFKKLDF